MRELGRRKAANAVLAFPLAACMDIMGYNHLVHIDDDNSRDLDLCTQSGSEDYGENASVAYTQSDTTLEINDQHVDDHRYPQPARRQRKQTYRTQSSLSLPPRAALLADRDAVWIDEKHSEIPRNALQIDHIHGVLRNSTPLFESIRRGKWKLASSFLQTRSVCRNTVSPTSTKEETHTKDIVIGDDKLEEEDTAPITLKVSPLELAQTWVSMYETDGTLVWRRLPLHEALRRGAPADLVYTLLELYPLAAEAEDTEGNLPLHLAMQYNAASDVVRIILQEYPQVMEIPNERGQLPLECVQSERGKDVLLPMRGQVLQRYVNSVKEIAYQHVPQLKTELFRVNKTIEGAKSELRLAKLELGMIKEHHRLLAERKIQEENNMKEEVHRLRAELETLRCEREQLAAEKDLWSEQREQDPWVVPEVLSADGGNNGAWISNEFNHMVTQLEQTSRLVHRNNNVHTNKAIDQGQAGDITQEYATKPSNDVMSKKKKVSNMAELQECRTDATELTHRQLSSEEEYEKKSPSCTRQSGDKSQSRSRAGSDDDDDSSADQGEKFNNMLLSIIQQADDDGALALPFDNKERNTAAATNSNYSHGSKKVGDIVAHPREAIKPEADTTVQDFPMPSTRKTSNLLKAREDEPAIATTPTTASVDKSSDNQETFDNSAETRKAARTIIDTADEEFTKLRKKMKFRNKTKPSVSKTLDPIEATRHEAEPPVDLTEQLQNESEPSRIALAEAETKVDERLSHQADEEQSAENASIAGVKSSESWEVFLRTNRADNQSTQEQRLAALWKTNAMAEDLANLNIKVKGIGLEGEESDALRSLVKNDPNPYTNTDANEEEGEKNGTLGSLVKANLNIKSSDIGEEGEEGDTLGPLVKVKPERKWRSKIREKLKKGGAKEGKANPRDAEKEKLKKARPTPETPKKPRREARDEDDSTVRETNPSIAVNGDVGVPVEKDLIEETRESFSQPFNEFDNAVNKTLTKLSKRTTSSSRQKRHHHSRGKSKARTPPHSHSKRQERDIYVTGEDNVEILTSEPQRSHSKRQERNIYVTDEEKIEILTSEPQLSFESRGTTATSVGPYRPSLFSDQDSLSIAGYNSLA